MYIKITNFVVCDRCEHQIITYFFHTDLFRNCIPSSVYVCISWLLILLRNYEIKGANHILLKVSAPSQQVTSLKYTPLQFCRHNNFVAYTVQTINKKPFLQFHFSDLLYQGH